MGIIVVIIVSYVFGLLCFLFPHKLLIPIDKLGFLLLRKFPWLRLRRGNIDIKIIEEEWKNNWIHKCQAWFVRMWGILIIMFATVALIVIIAHPS